MKMPQENYAIVVEYLAAGISTLAILEKYWTTEEFFAT